MSSTGILSNEIVEEILQTVGRLSIAVLGDLFLDRYLDLDATLTEPSLETGLDAYQVVRVRSHPGAAGTIINNLVALGVGRVVPITIIGDDGEGYELRQALGQLRGVDAEGVLTWPGRRTPTYTKPMLHQPGQLPRELNRFDIHNRFPLPSEAEGALLQQLAKTWAGLDGLIVLDQVSLPECGVVTTTIRSRVSDLVQQAPLPALADSRERIGLFRSVCLKPNQRECQRAVSADSAVDLSSVVRQLCRRAGAAVFCTRGEHGILLAQLAAEQAQEIGAFPVSGPIDPVGAGDSTSAGIVCALASGRTHREAAAFGNLVASITVQQIGTTGTATAEQVRQRFREVGAG